MRMPMQKFGRKCKNVKVSGLFAKFNKKFARQKVWGSTSIIMKVVKSEKVKVLYAKLGLEGFNH